MDLHLRGLLMGMFLGFGLGALFVWQPDMGWTKVGAGVAGIALLAYWEHAYVKNKSKAVA